MGRFDLPSATQCGAILRDATGLDVRIGIEHEFYIERGARYETDSKQILKSIFEKSGINLFPESGHFQFEYRTVPYFDIDTLISQHRADLDNITTICRENRWNLQLISRPFAHMPPNSIHINISLIDGQGRNCFVDRHGMLATEDSPLQKSIAGLVEYTPDLFVFFCPNMRSYERFVISSAEDKLFTPSNFTWGVNNRSVAFRVVYSRSDLPSTRIENRLPCGEASLERCIAATLWAIGKGFLSKTTELPYRIYGKACEHVASCTRISRDLIFA